MRGLDYQENGCGDGLLKPTVCNKQLSYVRTV